MARRCESDLAQAASPERALAVARQVLGALVAAHRTGVVHRDLKPENIMVRGDGYVKVLDFGLAKWLPSAPRIENAPTTMNVSHPGQLMGTVAYMSPEQILGQEVDGRSDLFALGIVLYEALAGRHPWPRSSSVDTLHAIVHDETPPFDATPQVGGTFAGVVQRLLSKRAAERYPSAESVLDALATITRRSESDRREPDRPATDFHCRAAVRLPE